MKVGPASDTSFAPFVKFNMVAVNRRFLLEDCFLYLWVLFNVNDDGKDKEPIDFGVGNAAHPGIVAVATMESGFHVIAAIATIAEIKLKSISAIVVAAIATIDGECFTYDPYDR